MARLTEEIILRSFPVDVGIHIDGVMKAPTILIDDHKIMEKGELLIAI